MRRRYAAAVGALSAMALILIATAAVQWADDRGEEFIKERMPEASAASASPPATQSPAKSDPQMRANAYGVAAAYLNYRYGFPIGALTALIGGVVTALGGFLGWRLTSRQGDVEILKFIELKISPAIKHQQRLTATVGSLLAWGYEAKQLSFRLKTQIESEGGPATSPLFALLVEIGRAFDEREFDDSVDVWALVKELEPSETTALSHAAIELVLALFRLSEQLTNVFDDVTSDMYSYFFCRLEAQSVDEAHRPLRRLASRLPDTASEHPSLFGDTLPDLSVSLSYFAKATRPVHLIVAAYRLPEDSLPLEFVGHVIFSLAATPYHLVEHQDVLTARYNYNFGAAYLITLVQAMPCKSTITAAFDKMFGDRSAVAKKFIQAVVPEKVEMGPSTILSSFAESPTNLNRLITTEVMTGDPRSLSVRGEFYQPGRHGPSPTMTDRGEPQNRKSAALASRALSGSVRP